MRSVIWFYFFKQVGVEQIQGNWVKGQGEVGRGGTLRQQTFYLYMTLAKHEEKGTAERMAEPWR